MEENRFDTKFTTHAGEVQLITNNQLQCLNCLHLFEKLAASCEIYEIKPRAVLKGEFVCKYFKEKNV